MDEGFIYCAISPSNKKYYGYTINFEKRKRDHHAAVNFGKHNKFYNAIRKYGWNNIKWKIIETIKSNSKKELRDILSEREIYWIKRDKTQFSGYNITPGGGGRLGIPHTEESKGKIRFKNSGTTHPNFGKHRKLSTVELNKTSNTGQKRTDKTKDNIRISLIGKKHLLKDFKCPYCNLKGKGPNMMRYHFNNCKNKK